MNVIDWEFVLEGYNRSKKANFTLVEMLTDVYVEKGTLRKAADFFGVAKDALVRKMDLLEIPRVRRGRRYNTLAAKLSGLPEETFEGKSVREISEILRISESTIYRWKRFQNKNE